MAAPRFESATPAPAHAPSAPAFERPPAPPTPVRPANEPPPYEPPPGAAQFVNSKDNLDGKLLGWGQTSLGHGQSGCLIHELHCESETVVYKGDCSTWTDFTWRLRSKGI